MNKKIKFSEFKTFISYKLSFDNLYKSDNMKNKQIITFKKNNNEYKEEKSILKNNLKKTPDNVQNKSIQFINYLKTNSNNNETLKLKFSDDNESKLIEDLNEYIKSKN